MEVFSLKTYDKILSFENDFYKELYEDGIKQRNQLNSKFTPTITILSAEISGIIWIIFQLLKSIEANNNTIHTSDMCVFLFLGFTLISFVVAIANFILCFTNYDFSYPKPDKAKTFIDNNKSCLGDYTEKEVLNNIIRNISNDYIKIAISNCEETNKHSSWLNKCYIGIVVTLGLMVVDFVLVLFL